jgi:oligopeptide transport system substrate-binding protein
MLTACTQKASDDGAIINVCIASEPETIDPQLNTAVDGAVMNSHFFEGLIKWVDDGNGNAINEPGMAESYEKTTDGDQVVYTFKMREDAKWSDGEPVTAQDFEYTWKRLIDPATAADYSYMIDMVVNANEILAGEKPASELGITAIDDSTLEIRLFYDCPYFIEVCAFPACFPVRQDIIESAGDQWTFDVKTFVTNGPYKMESWSHNEEIAMVKNENYYDYDNLGPARINFKLMDDENAMLAGYRSGELDFIESVPTDEVATLLASGELTVHDYIGTYYVCFQVENAPFDDPKVREAFSLAIDRNYIVETVAQAGQLPASGYVPSGISDKDGPSGDDFRTQGGDYYSVDPADYQANCDRARELLAEAGYPGGEGFPVVEYLYNTNDGHKAIGEALQNMWQNELGVQVTLQNEEWNTFLQTRKDGDYHIARNGWIGDFNDPISFIDMFITGSGNNDAQYSNPAYDEYVATAKSTSDQAVRMEAMHKAEDLLMKEDVVVAPIYFYVNTWMLNEKVTGMYYTPLGYMFFGYTDKAE